MADSVRRTKDEKFFFMISPKGDVLDLTYYNVDHIRSIVIGTQILVHQKLGWDSDVFDLETPSPIFDGIIGSNFMHGCLDTIGKLRPDLGPIGSDNLRAAQHVTKNWISAVIFGTKVVQYFNPMHVTKIQYTQDSFVRLWFGDDLIERHVEFVKF